MEAGEIDQACVGLFWFHQRVVLRRQQRKECERNTQIYITAQ